MVRYVAKEYTMIWYLCRDSGLVVWKWACGWRLCKVYLMDGRAAKAASGRLGGTQRHDISVLLL